MVDTLAVAGGGTLPGAEIASAGDRPRRRPSGRRCGRRPSRSSPGWLRAGPSSTCAPSSPIRTPWSRPPSAGSPAGGEPDLHVVATAGHVDHGKSTLVEALTGTDPDRWAEEKARGLTIDLGFAHTEVDDLVVSFVDVPGHVRFLANMLAGVGGVVACLFVVDALEGWKPQSEEHLRILELVGVDHGVVALTKVDRAEPDLVAVARLELAERLAGTFLADAEVVEVAAPVGRGLAELRAALGRTLRATPAVADTGRPRLWVDRAFAAKGAGTVVTGTLLGGHVAVDDRLVVRPGGPEVRVPRHPGPSRIGRPTPAGQPDGPEPGGGRARPGPPGSGGGPPRPVARDGHGRRRPAGPRLAGPPGVPSGRLRGPPGHGRADGPPAGPRRPRRPRARRVRHRPPPPGHGPPTGAG